MTHETLTVGHRYQVTVRRTKSTAGKEFVYEADYVGVGRGVHWFELAVGLRLTIEDGLIVGIEEIAAV